MNTKTEQLWLYLGNSSIEPQDKWFVILADKASYAKGNLGQGVVVGVASNSAHDLGAESRTWSLGGHSFVPFHKITEDVFYDLVNTRKIIKENSMVL